MLMVAVRRPAGCLTFCASCDALVQRSRARGRRAVVLADNAHYNMVVRILEPLRIELEPGRIRVP